MSEQTTTPAATDTRILMATAFLTDLREQAHERVTEFRQAVATSSVEYAIKWRGEDAMVGEAVLRMVGLADAEHDMVRWVADDATRDGAVKYMRSTITRVEDSFLRSAVRCSASTCPLTNAAETCKREAERQVREVFVRVIKALGELAE